LTHTLDRSIQPRILSSYENLKKWCALQEEEIEELRKLFKNK